MPEKPVWYQPVRDPELPPGDGTGSDVNSGLTFGFIFEPTVGAPTLTTHAVSGLDTQAVMLGVELVGDSLYVLARGRIGGSRLASINIYEFSLSGAIVRSVRLPSIVGQGGRGQLENVHRGLGSDSSGLYVITGTNRGQFDLWRVAYNLTSPTLVGRIPSGAGNFLTLQGDFKIVDNELWALTNLNGFATRPVINRESLADLSLVSGGQISLSASVARYVGDYGFEVTEDRVYIFTGTGGAVRVAAFQRDGTEVANEGFAVPDIVSGAQQFEGGIARSGTAIYTFPSTTELREYTLSIQPIQDYSLRRIAGIGAGTTEYYNGSGWQSTETPQPASQLTNAGRVRDPGVTRYSLFVSSWASSQVVNRYEVRNRDAAGVWSPWSDRLTVRAGPALGVNIITPDMDNGDLSAEFNPQWVVTGGGQAYYRVSTRVRAIGREYQRTGVIATSTTSHIWGSSGTDQLLTSLPDEPDEASILEITVEVWSAALVRTVSRRTATIRYLAPPFPTGVRFLDRIDIGAIEVLWTLGTPTGGEPNAARIEVWRREVGKEEGLYYEDNTPTPSGVFVDHWVPFNRVVQYRVVALGARGQHREDTPWVE